MPAGVVSPEAIDINNSGQVAANAYTPDYRTLKAVIWTNGQPFVLPNLEGTDGSYIYDINNQGEVVGQSYSATTSNTRSLKWTSTHSLVDLNVAGSSAANGINDSDLIVGSTSSGAFHMNSPGAYEFFPLVAMTPPYATAINNLGSVLIDPGFLVVNGNVRKLSTNGGGRALNDRNQVVGQQVNFSSMPYFLPTYWDESGSQSLLPLPSNPGIGAFPRGINYAGVIVGNAEGQPIIWRKNPSGVYEVELLAPQITNGAGWSNLFVAAINESGQIAGDGLLGGTTRAFILNPGPAFTLSLRTDADRSGTTDFDSSGDVTAPGRPFYFWTNDDHDHTGDDVDGGAADSADDRILNPVLVTASGGSATVVRDLEDFSRLAFKLTPDLKTALEAGATLRLEAAGAGTIHLFSTPSTDAETRYLTDEPFAVSLISDVATDVALTSTVSANGITLWENVETLIKPEDWVAGRVRFLWEGVTPGACILTLKLTRPDGTEIVSDPVHLSLHPVQDYFERACALPRNGFPPPYSADGSVPAMTWGLVYPQVATPSDQQNVDLVWVHGWRLTEYERQNWAEMMFKRLWHAGYKGRLHAFTWPTYSADEEPKTDGFLSFDRSEFRAWKSGAALDAYLRVVRNAHSGGRLALIAHSMGNIVTGEALRRGAPADLQIMMQAAVSAGCYDARAVLEESSLLDYEDKRPTPDFDVDLGYRGFLSHINVPTINCYNEVDYALQTGKATILGVQVSWFAHQGDKPYDPNGMGAYKYNDNRAGFYRGQRLLREVTDVHESLAFLARSRTKATGAQPFTGFTVTGSPLGTFKSRLNLHASPYEFTNADNEHSAQFNRPIQRQLMNFYKAIVDTVSPVFVP